MTHTICGSDVHTPRAAADALTAVADTYAALLTSIDQSRSNQIAMGLAGAPIDLLSAMLDAATTVTGAARSAARQAEQHCQTVADTVGADPTLAGTQSGKYMDPAAL